MSAKTANHRNRWIIAGVTGVLVVGGSAAFATAAFAGEGETKNNSGSSQLVDDDDYKPGSEPSVALADAIATAADEVSKGIMTSAELEGKKDAPVWKVEFITSDGTEHDVHINDKGSVGEHKKDSDDDDGDDDDWSQAKQADKKASTSAADAATTALDKAGSGVVTSVELEEDDGDHHPYWDVDVAKDGKQSELTVDATNGKIVSNNDDDDGRDDDSDDDDDDRDDDNDDDGDDD